MAIRPMSEEAIWDLINRDEASMNQAQERLWQAIRITPERWEEPAYGHLTSGFWAVAVIGDRVIWYNEIERGFNVSSYPRYGQIGEYVCDDHDLGQRMHDLLVEISDGIP